jgi:hypothetical protein
MSKQEGALKKDLDRNQLLLVVGLLVVLLGLVYFFFLKGGGEEPADLGAVPPVGSPAPAASVPVSEVDPDDDSPVETFEVFTDRDPFEPVIDLSDDAGGPVSTLVTTPEGEVVENGGTFAPDPTDDSTTDDTTDDTDDTDNNVSGTEVRVVDVFRSEGSKRAQIRVEGTVYIVDEGETFAESFRLLSISGKCASLLFGDDQFTLCEGESAVK